MDSNVILDVFTDDPIWCSWSGSHLDSCSSTGPLYINAVIYGEVSIRFERIEQLESALPEEDFARLELPFEAAFLAGKAFRDYKSRGGTRTATLPDFFIGAHAAVLGLNLLTRDDARFRTYFPTVKLISP